MIGGECVEGEGLAIEFLSKGLKWPLMNDRTLKNQPKTGGRDVRWYGGET